MTRPALCPICNGDTLWKFPTPFPDLLWECDGCGGRFVYPLPHAKDLEARYEEEHRSGKWGDLFDDTPLAETVRRAGQFTDLVGRPGRVLDVGFGDGRFLSAAAASGWETWGLEVSEAAARSVEGRHQVLVGELSAFGTGSHFDAVTFWDVLEHVPDPAGMVADAARLLRPGGVMAVTMPNVFGTESKLRGRRWKYYDVALYGHLFHLAPHHISIIFERAGLSTIYTETRGSTDLRDLLANSGGGLLSRTGRLILDRVSGVVSRLAQPVKRGNTLMVIGRAPEANKA